MESLLQLLSPAPRGAASVPSAQPIELEATEMARIVGGTLSSFSDVTITGSYTAATTASYYLQPADPCRSSSTLFV